MILFPMLWQARASHLIYQTGAAHSGHYDYQAVATSHIRASIGEAAYVFLVTARGL